MFLGLNEIIPAKSEHTVKLFEKAWNKSYNHNKITEQLSQKSNGYKQRMELGENNPSRLPSLAEIHVLVFLTAKTHSQT